MQITLQKSELWPHKPPLPACTAANVWTTPASNCAPPGQPAQAWLSLSMRGGMRRRKAHLVQRQIGGLSTLASRPFHRPDVGAGAVTAPSKEQETVSSAKNGYGGNRGQSDEILVSNRFETMTASWREKMKSLLQEDLNDLRGGHDITQSEDSEVSREEAGIWTAQQV